MNKLTLNRESLQPLTQPEDIQTGNMHDYTETCPKGGTRWTCGSAFPGCPFCG